MSYRSLDARAILKTLDTLSARVSERFAGRGIEAVCQELAALARTEIGEARRIQKPYRLLRVLVALVLGAAVFTVAWLGWTYRAEIVSREAFLRFEGLEAMINMTILAAAGTWFLMSLEARQKRHRVLTRLHALRSLAHVVDMHQLTKDPSVIMTGAQPTASSPKRDLTPYQMLRYLDYCAEMQALIGKLAAIYLEYSRDTVVISAVNEIENLTNDLARKIWQKISVLEGAINR